MADNLFDVLSSKENVESDTPNVNTTSPAEEDLSFFEMAAVAPDPEEEVGYWQSVLNSVPKGLVKGTIALGRAMGPLPEGEDQHYDPNEIAGFLENQFPTTDDFIPGTIERAGKIAPLILAGPGGSGKVAEPLIRTGLAAASGEASKQAGAPEWLQDIVEVVPLLAPDLSKMNAAGAGKDKILEFVKKKAPNSIGKKLDKMISRGQSKSEILDFSRKMGMTEEEITPLLQGEAKQKWLSGLASKGDSTKETLKQTKAGIGRVFESVKNSPEATAEMTSEQSTRLIKQLQDKFSKMNSSVRNLVKEDFQDFINGPKTGKAAIELFHKINHEWSAKNAILGTAKGPIIDMLKEIDPVLGESLEMTNKLYSKYAKIADRLKPGLADIIMKGGKITGALAGAMWGMVSGDFGALVPIAGFEGARKVAEKMLTSPRLQGLVSKTVSALNQGKWVVAEHIKSQMIDEVKDFDPNIAQALEATNIEEMFNPK